jgi:hypothetical protein
MSSVCDNCSLNCLSFVFHKKTLNIMKLLTIG